jgi:orotidine-5'-phosphate decarboxylase
MTREQLIATIYSKKSYLCVGLDSDIDKMPKHLMTAEDPVFEFNRQIIDATKDLCVGYKINTAFYESRGLEGWKSMEKTVNYISDEHFRIADAKRGDIGNTSSQYAKAFFEAMNFDAITVAPYMGEDSIRPFLEYEDKWTILLGLTSNPGSKDFELKKIRNEEHVLDEGVHTIKKDESFLYEEVLKKASGWSTPSNLMFVIGATQPEQFVNIRRLTPNHFYLVPGIGAQGGSLKEISEKALIPDDCGLLVNASRAIIFASGGEDFAEKARAVAEVYQREMAGFLGVS